MTPPNNRKFTIYAHPSTNDLHLSWQNDGSDAIISPVYSGVFPTNKWTHCCITYNNPTGTVYINGKQHTTFTMTSDSSSFANETPVIHNSDKRLMQDLRVYDHCLTPREVKHIAQGLAWHWKLDSIANPNLVSDIVARKNVVKLNNYSLNLDLAPRNDSYFNIKVTPALEINKTYTLSFDVSDYPE